ncbi:MAG TPA: hypothetical protein VKV17_14275 [Bryobacteraceae bacterium]|nr:hypothetical protein [Bryobacteraceae bacterium]
MRKPLLIAFGIAAVIVIVAIAAVFWAQKGAHMELRGQILKVRTAPLDENHSVAVVDFRFLNLADYEYEVRQVTVTVADKSGMTIEGMTIPEIDAQHLFAAIPLLGQKYNPSLIVRNRIPAHVTQDRMIAASFPVPEDQLDMRRGLTVRVQEHGGVISEITGN